MNHLAPLVLFGCIAVPSARGQLFEAELECLDPQSLDAFGMAAAIDGDFALIGAPGEDEGGDGAGAAYMYTRTADGWRQLQKLMASDPQPGAGFGFRVALEADLAIVTAFGADSEAGKAYVFEWMDPIWRETGQLSASDSGPNNRFGRSLDLDGRQLIIGSPHAHPHGPLSGSAYVFVRQPGGWVETDRLQALDGLPVDTFGRSVGIDEDSIVVGAWGRDGIGPNSGAAYVFTRTANGWSQVQELRAADAHAEANFGVSCSLSGDTIAVGAYRGSSTGAVYTFQRVGSDFVQTQKLRAADHAVGDKFGAFLDLREDTLVIAARENDDRAQNSGSVYVFRRYQQDWIEAAKLIPDSAKPYSWFGNGVAISDKMLLVGEPGDPAHATISGAAYVIELARPLGRTSCYARSNSTGARATLASEGFGAVSAGYLRLTSLDVPPGQPGRFIASQLHGMPTAPAGIPTGLCLGGPPQLASGVLISDPAGVVSHAPDLWSLAAGEAVRPGETWGFQLWFRDGDLAGTPNTSDAMALMFDSEDDPL